jgi:hypothetical protein
MPPALRGADDQVEPAEPDPGLGWLRSRFMRRAWPRAGVARRGRASCPVCGPIARKEERAADVLEEATSNPGAVP